jgi:hypothetical protein
MSNIADVRRKEIAITLSDGVERKLRFTLNALAELEEMFGTVQEAFDRLEKNNSLVALRAILWAGFIEDDPDLTLKKLGSLIDLADMSSLTETVAKAFAEDMPVETESPNPPRLVNSK